MINLSFDKNNEKNSRSIRRHGFQQIDSTAYGLYREHPQAYEFEILWLPLVIIFSRFLMSARNVELFKIPLSATALQLQFSEQKKKQSEKFWAKDPMSE